MISWAATGRTFDEFWSLTLRQIDCVFKGYAKKINQEAELHSNLAAYQVWRLAHMMRFKRLPKKPDDLLDSKKNKPSTGPDWKAQKQAIEMLNAAVGGFDNRKKERKKGD